MRSRDDGDVRTLLPGEDGAERASISDTGKLPTDRAEALSSK